MIPGLGLHDHEAPSRRVRLFRYLFGIPYAPQQTAIRQLETMGTSPTNVKHIIQTHLHFDHAGGLPDFPWAQVHVHRKEYAAVLKPKTLLEWSAYDKADFSRKVNHLVYQYGSNRSHLGLEKAIEFLFTCQTETGGLRGILATNTQLIILE